MSESKYTTILFDLDGTISDSAVGITKSVQYALKKHGIIVGDSELSKLQHFVGPPLLDEFMKSYSMSKEVAAECVDDYRERYIPTGIYETSLYPGIRNCIEKLKDNGKKIGLATSKPQPMAEEVLKYLEIYELFDFVMGAELVGPRQSKGAVLQALLSQFDETVLKSQIVLVGDTIYDVLGAKEKGIDCIGVSYGYGSVKEMLDKGAVGVAGDANQLLELILTR